MKIWEQADTDKVEPPMPPTSGRYEVVIDNDSIQRLDLSPFQTATGITSPSSGNQSIIYLHIQNVEDGGGNNISMMIFVCS